MLSAYTHWRNNVKGTLRYRFAAWTTILLFVVLMVFSTFVYVTMRRSLLTTVDQGLQSTAVQTLGGIEYEYGGIEAPHDTLAGNSSLDASHSTVFIMDAQGRNLSETGNGPRPKLSEADLTLALSGRDVSRTVNGNVRIFILPIEVNSDVLGVVYVTRSLTDVAATLRTLLTFLLMSIPILAVVAGGSGYFLARRALQPIDSITRTASELSATDLSARLNLPASNDEVGRLATTFDSMLDRLDQAFERERQFTGDASHELRTPVTAIQTILDVTAIKERSPQEYQKALTDIGQQTSRLQRLLTSLLILARGDQMRMSRHMAVNLSKVVSSTTHSLRPVAEQKGVTLQATVSPSVSIQGNQEGLERVVTNLIENAIKYTDNGDISVHLSQKQDTALLEVKDTGIGVEQQHIEHLFDRFYRVEQSRTSNGVGLGLSMVKQIVEAHKGTIKVVSSYGEGTTFVVSLPIEKWYSEFHQSAQIAETAPEPVY